MMKLYIYKGKDYHDITEAVEGIKWKGDYKQVARTIDFNLVHPVNDKNIKVINPVIGDEVVLHIYGLECFRGQVWNKTVDTSSNTDSISCVDKLKLISKSDVSKAYKNVAPQDVAKSIASEFKLKHGSIAEANYKRDYIAFGKNAYDVIMASYTHASKSNGKKYMLRFMGGAMHVIEKGTSIVNLILDENENLTKATYSQSLEQMYNSIIVYNSESGKHILKEENKDDIKKYGLMQKTINEEEGKDNRKKAKEALKGIEKKAAVEAFGHPYCLAGNIVYVKDSHTGLIGKFFIDSDEHNISKEVYEMKLTLNFENIMDEKTMDEELKETKPAGGGKPSGGNKTPTTPAPKPGNDWVFEHTDCAGHGMNPK